MRQRNQVRGLRGYPDVAEIQARKSLVVRSATHAQFRCTGGPCQFTGTSGARIF